MFRSTMALAACFMILAPQAHAEVPKSVAEAIGGATAISLYTSHALIGLAATADHADEEKLKAAASAVGGTLGGLELVEQQLRAAAKDLPAGEAETVVGLADIAADVQKQGKHLLDALKAKAEANDAAAKKAMTAYTASRALCAKKIGETLGIPAEVLK